MASAVFPEGGELIAGTKPVFQPACSHPDGSMELLPVAGGGWLGDGARTTTLQKLSAAEHFFGDHLQCT